MLQLYLGYWIGNSDGNQPGFHKYCGHLLSLRVQVSNNHILPQNLYYNYYYPNPKYLNIGYLDPKGLKFPSQMRWDLSSCPRGKSQAFFGCDCDAHCFTAILPDESLISKQSCPSTDLFQKWSPHTSHCKETRHIPAWTPQRIQTCLPMIFQSAPMYWQSHLVRFC